MHAATSSASELRFKEVLEALTGHAFFSARPNWLLNHTGHAMELDMFSADLGVAIEYDGPQHYQFPNPYHATEEEFEAQRARDALKDRLCAENGVRLYRVRAQFDVNAELGGLRAAAPHLFTVPQCTVTWDVLQRSATLHAYAVVKAVFERSHFKVMHPVCYVCDEPHGGGGSGLVIREEGKLRAAYRNLYCSVNSSADGAATTRRVPFIKSWLDDPLIRTYHSMDFMPPPLQCPPSVYNMWSGLAVDHLPCADEGGGDGDADAASAQPFLDHVKLLAGGEEAAADYLVKWLAHLVQRPGELNSVAVILKSLQGCGKNILLDGMRLILGDDLFFETANPEQDVFGRFAAGRKNRLLVNIDESGALRFVSQLKNMLTSATLNYEQKGVDPITLRNFNRVIITTNLDLPCKVEADDRRYVMFECSPARRGDKPYFDAFARYLRDPRSQSAIAAHLRTVDISAVNWMADRPVSELYREARYDCLDLVVRFMEALHLAHCADAQEEHRVHGGPLFALFTDWLRQTNHPTATWNSTNFGRRMGEYVKTSGGAVTKTADGARRAVYAFHRARMEAFLAARGLLIGRGYAFDT